MDLARARLAERFNLDLGEVIIGAGSDEIIELLSAKTYLSPPDHVVVSASAFMQYRLAAQLMGASVTSVPLKDMKHDLMGMVAATTNRTKMVFIANPNNPTGTYNTRQEVDAFLSALSPRVLPVFDEAYYDYAAVNADYPSMLDNFERNRPDGGAAHVLENLRARGAARRLRRRARSVRHRDGQDPPAVQRVDSGASGRDRGDGRYLPREEVGGAQREGKSVFGPRA